MNLYDDTKSWALLDRINDGRFARVSRVTGQTSLFIPRTSTARGDL
jgi:hypothetical protein